MLDCGLCGWEACWSHDPNRMELGSRSLLRISMAGVKR